MSSLSTVRPRTTGLLVPAFAAAVVTSVVALLLAGGRPVAAPLGLPDAGVLTGWAVRGGRLLVDLSAVVTVGSLLVGAVLVPARGVLSRAAVGAVRSAAQWAAAWGALALLTAVLTVSDAAGVPLTQVTPRLLLQLGTRGQGGALVVVTALAALVAVGARRVTTTRGSRALLLVALAGLLPLALVGHAASAADHDVATSGLVVHVVAAALWVGGLAGILVHLRAERDVLATAVARFSLLALGAYAALLISGLVTAMTRLGTSPSLWTSGYGALVTAKVVALVLLGVLGHLHRRRTIDRIAEGRPRGFLRLAGAELVVMGAAIGLAAALSRTPVPSEPVPTTPAHGVGHATLPASISPISLAELATHWRWNAIVLLVLGLALTAYVAGIRALGRRGVPWSRARTGAFVAGLVVALLDLCSGIATYAPALVSVQLVQFLVALLLIPLLVTLGTPLTLLLQVQGSSGSAAAALRSPLARGLSSPLTGAGTVCVLLLVVYRTPLIELSLRSFWVHLLVLALALLSGLVLLWSVLAVDALAQRAGVAERVTGMAAVVGSLALLASQLRFGDRLLAGRWFLELRWSWVDPVADQRLAGAIVGGVAVASLLLLALAARRPGDGAVTVDANASGQESR